MVAAMQTLQCRWINGVLNSGLINLYKQSSQGYALGIRRVSQAWTKKHGGRSSLLEAVVDTKSAKACQKIK